MKMSWAGDWVVNNQPTRRVGWLVVELGSNKGGGAWGRGGIIIKLIVEVIKELSSIVQLWFVKALL
jgi:hypothetical protein